MILDWSSDKSEVVARLRRTPADFRICLKTKDDTHFLREWLVHHRDIVADEALLIFDNGSTEPSVLEAYEQISGSILVVRFQGMMNNLHRPQFYPELYQALADSSRYYTFIDTDEFLFWVDENGGIVSGRQLGDRIALCIDPVIPGIWLNNVKGYRDRFWMSSKHDHFTSGIRSGKPIVQSSVELVDMSNHNRHIPAEHWRNCTTGNVLIAHLKHLYPDQRVKANLQKLRAYNFMQQKFTDNDILDMDAASLPVHHARLVKEIQEFSKSTEFTADPAAPLHSGHAQILDGKLVFGDPEVGNHFFAYVRNPKSVVSSILGSIS